MEKYKHFNRFKTIGSLWALVVIITIFVFIGIYDFKKEYTTLAEDALLKEATAHYNNMISFSVIQNYVGFCMTNSRT